MQITDVEYEVCTLADLIDTCQSINSEVGNAVSITNTTSVLAVHPSEIRISSESFNRIWLHLTSERLTDGSTVYNVEVR